MLRAVLNGQSSVWQLVTAGVAQGSVLDPLLFLIYINDRPLGLIINVKLFGDDTSLISGVSNASVSAVRLNNDLVKIRDWDFNWKMSLLDPTKQAKEVIFSKKITPGTHLSLFFNNSLIEQDTTQKHLGLTLDHKLAFQYHVNEKMKKAMKGIRLLRKLQSILPRTSLLTIYKSFIRPHLDYGDVVYDQPSNDAFSNKLETVQYNAALAITGAIKGTSREKLYQELGLEYLQQRRWMRRLCLFYKVVSTKLPAYNYDIIPPVRQSQRHPNTFDSISCRNEYFKNSFFLCVIGEWNKLNREIRKSGTYNTLLTLFGQVQVRFIISMMLSVLN